MKAFPAFLLLAAGLAALPAVADNIPLSAPASSSPTAFSPAVSVPALPPPPAPVPAVDAMPRIGQPEYAIYPLLGLPKGRIVLPNEIIMMYDRGNIILKDGYISDVKLQTASAYAAQMARDAAALAQRQQTNTKLAALRQAFLSDPNYLGLSTRDRLVALDHFDHQYPGSGIREDYDALYAVYAADLAAQSQVADLEKRLSLAEKQAAQAQQQAQLAQQQAADAQQQAANAIASPPSSNNGGNGGNGSNGNYNNNGQSVIYYYDNGGSYYPYRSGYSLGRSSGAPNTFTIAPRQIVNSNPNSGPTQVHSFSGGSMAVPQQMNGANPLPMGTPATGVGVTAGSL